MRGGDRRPVVRARLAEEFRDDVLAAALPGDEAGAVGVMEDPDPPGLLADPHSGLVRRQDGAGEQPGADQARLPGEGFPAVIEYVDQGALADVEAEEVAEQVRQPFERDRLGKAQVERKGSQIGAEWRARFQVRRRRRLEPLGAAWTHPAIKRDAGDIGFDLGNLDAVIGFAGGLRGGADIAAAVLALCRRHMAMARRVGMERPMRPGVRLAPRLRGGRLFGLGGRCARCLVSLRGRRARIVRRLRR